MKRYTITFLVAALAAATMCKAESSCPWINRATALGILGASDDSHAMDSVEVTPTSCTFLYPSQTGKRELRVMVEHLPTTRESFSVYRKRCGTGGIALQAIGNEAILCSREESPSSHGSEVIGRVRDNLFTIRLTTSVKGDSLLTKDSLPEKAKRTAEQVAGNLF